MTSTDWKYRSADPESVVRRGPALTFFFSLVRWGRIRIPLFAGHHRPARETPFKWRFAGVLMMSLQWMLAWYNVALWFLRGSGPVLLRNPIFCDFPGGSGPPVPLWIRARESSLYRSHLTAVWSIKWHTHLIVISASEDGDELDGSC